MNELLHRLIGRARGASSPASLRIEPLLAPQYAGVPRSGIHFEEIATHDHAHEQSHHAPASPEMTVRPPRLARIDEAGETNAARSEFRGVPEAPVAPSPPTLIERVQWPQRTRATRTDAAPPGQQPSRADDAAVPARDHVEERTTLPAAMATPTAPSPSRAARRADQRGSESAHATSVAGAQSAALSETTQTFTFSIGHVEVRHAPPPVATPRRSAFRPSVSLDAFLGRRGSDKR